MRYKTDPRSVLLLLAGAFAGGCSSMQDPPCELTAAETQQLQTSARAFLAQKLLLIAR